MLLNKFLKKIDSLTTRKNNDKPTSSLSLGKKGRFGFSSYVAVVLCICCFSTTAFAASSSDPLGVVNNLSTFLPDPCHRYDFAGLGRGAGRSVLPEP